VRLATAALYGRQQAVLVTESDTLVPLRDLLPGLGGGMLEVIRAGPDVLRELRESSAAADHRGYPIEDAVLLAPIPYPARSVFAVGWNYRRHFEEGRGIHAANEMPEWPAFFSKEAATVVGPEALVEFPTPHSTMLDWEVELAVVLGRGGRDIAPEEAREHIFGYTVANDVTVRDVQRRHGNQWFKGKNYDTHLPMGPWIVTADEIDDRAPLGITSRVNGVTKQDSDTSYMAFSVERLISELSLGTSLHAGDILLTGTPEGVGFGRDPQEFLQPGDLVEVEVAGIGTLRNRVVLPSQRRAPALRRDHSAGDRQH
jgi:2-keto-4-pentenoate hydratase/2-oxohepta-3-ene-1,7-dioic acid hydratase in catechol pathway